MYLSKERDFKAIRSRTSLFSRFVGIYGHVLSLIHRQIDIKRTLAVTAGAIEAAKRRMDMDMDTKKKKEI